MTTYNLEGYDRDGNKVYSKSYIDITSANFNLLEELRKDHTENSYHSVRLVSVKDEDTKED